MGTTYPNKPDDIAQRDWDAACRVDAYLVTVDVHLTPLNVEAIARALAAHYDDELPPHWGSRVEALEMVVDRAREWVEQLEYAERCAEEAKEEGADEGEARRAGWEYDITESFRESTELALRYEERHSNEVATKEEFMNAGGYSTSPTYATLPTRAEFETRFPPRVEGCQCATWFHDDPKNWSPSGHHILCDHAPENADVVALDPGGSESSPKES